MSGLSQKTVVFLPSFLGSRFTSVWPEGNGIGGDGGEHFGDERILLAGSRTGGVDRSGKVSRSVECSLEAHAGEIDMMDMGSALHKGSDEIVSHEMDEDFLFDHLGALATQDIHAQSDLDLMEVEFHIPAFGVEFLSFFAVLLFSLG